MFCGHCGTKLNPNTRFCAHCGAPVPQKPQQSSGQSQPAPAPAVTHSPKLKTTSRKKSNTAFTAVMIVLIVILVLAIAAFVVAVLTGGIFTTEEPAPTEESVAVDEATPETEPPEEISANPVPEGNPYRDFYTEAEYILPESHVRYYAPAELANLSDQALEIACAEISARHGIAPGDASLQEYFASLSWYSPKAGSAQLNTYEEENLFLIDVCQRQRDGSIYRTSNPYMAYSDLGTNYFIANSDNRYLTGADLRNLNETELIIARNEIFARHGYIFNDAVLKEYFCCESWYVPSVLSTDFDSSAFCDQENANLQLIQVYEDILDGIYPASDNPYTPYYRRNYEYIFSDSSTRLLTERDVQYLSIPELIIARNEIFARRGYCFTNDHLMQYFMQCSWYRPDVAPGRLDLLSLNSTENQNVNFLLDYQDKKEDLAELDNLDTSLDYSVETDLYCIYLPNYWEDYCVYTSSDGHSLRFCEKLSQQSIGGGHLFTVTTYSSTDFYNLPSYELLGYITDNNGNYWYLVAIYPTDVQFDSGNEALYAKMSGEISRILSTLTLKDGYSYA